MVPKPAGGVTGAGPPGKIRRKLDLIRALKDGTQVGKEGRRACPVAYGCPSKNIRVGELQITASFIHSFSKSLLSTYNVLGALQGTGHIMVNKADKSPCPMEFTFKGI